MQYRRSPFSTLLLLLLGSALLFTTACDSDSDPVGDDPGDDPDPGPEVRQVTYDLPNVEGNDITDSDATATFQEFGDQTLVTLELEDGATNTDLSHVAHIHENDVETSGDIAYFLGPLDGLAAEPGTSEFVVDESFDALIEFDGYINIHESNAEFDNILAQGNIGSNEPDADVVESDLIPLEEPRTTEYDLGAVDNDGALPDGDAATATFTEVTETQTLVTLELEGGATDTDVSHPAHIHDGALADQPGDIEIFLGPIDGHGAAPGVSYALVDEAYDDLVEFDGYINIHESNAAPGNIVSQGNIGANANGDDSGSGNGGGY